MKTEFDGHNEFGIETPTNEVRFMPTLIKLGKTVEKIVDTLGVKGSEEKIKNYFLLPEGWAYHPGYTQST